MFCYYLWTSLIDTKPVIEGNEQFAIDVHFVIVRGIGARIGFGRRCVERVVECDRRQSIVSNCDIETPKTCLEKTKPKNMLL